MISKPQIRTLINDLNLRKAHLYHACQLEDLRSYLKQGGVPSKDLMVREKLASTPTWEDAPHQKNGVGDKVFFHLADTGAWFAKGRTTQGAIQSAPPNPRGPILCSFKVHPMHEQ